MISYIRHNSVFDLGSRTGVSTCVGLYKELDDIYSKYINPQVRVQYDNTDCLCNMSGKQTLEGGSHAFVFHNGSISVTVDEQDNVTVAEAGSGGGGGVSGLALNITTSGNVKTLDKTFDEITAYLNLKTGIAPVVYTSDMMGEAVQHSVIIEADTSGVIAIRESGNKIVIDKYQYNDDGYPEITVS